MSAPFPISLKKLPLYAAAHPCVSAATLLLSLLPCLATAQTIRSKTFESVSPNGKVSITSRCDGERHSCDVSARVGGSVVAIGPPGYPSGPSIHWVNLDTAAVEFKCGEGCVTTWFFNPRLGRSAAYHGVLAVDGIRMRAAVGNDQRQEIELLPIQAQEGATPTCRIRRDWSPPGVSTREGRNSRTVFHSDGSLRLEYLRGAPPRIVTEEIPIDRGGAC